LILEQFSVELLNLVHQVFPEVTLDDGDGLRMPVSLFQFNGFP